MTSDKKTPTTSEVPAPAEAPEPLSFSDTVGSLNGFEEDLIVTRFGRAVGTLYMEVSITKAYRALIFILGRREGLKDAVAFKAAMDMPAKEVFPRFIDDSDAPEEVDPSSPDTEQGKDDSPSD